MFDYHYNYDEIPSNLFPILKALEELDKVKGEEMQEYRDELEREDKLKFSGKDLLENAIKNEILYPVEIDNYKVKRVYYRADRGDFFNVIPARGRKGVCCESLLVFIGDKDNFEIRILQTLEHLGVVCRGTTRYVVFYAYQWKSLIWEGHYNSFKRLVSDGVLKCVVKKMFKEKPVRLI